MGDERIDARGELGRRLRLLLPRSRLGRATEAARLAPDRRRVLHQGFDLQLLLEHERELVQRFSGPWRPPATVLDGCYAPCVRRPLTTDFSDQDRRPYFLWDEDVSVRELRAVLTGPDEHERDRLLGKVLREARDLDVWTFITPARIAELLPGLERRLGRRAAFWRYLIEGWRADGLV